MSEIIKKPFFSSESFAKIAIYIGGFIFAYATMSAKLEENIRTSERIEKNQKEQKEYNELQRDVMKAQIGAIQVDIAVIKKQIEKDAK